MSFSTKIVAYLVYGLYWLGIPGFWSRLYRVFTESLKVRGLDRYASIEELANKVKTLKWRPDTWKELWDASNSAAHVQWLMSQGINFIGDCLPVDTLVLTEKLEFRKLEDVKVGDRIIGDGVPVTVKAVVKKGVLPTMMFKLTNGNTLRCTPDHKVFAVIDGDAVEVTAKDLKRGDDLLVVDTIPDNGTSTDNYTVAQLVVVDSMLEALRIRVKYRALGLWTHVGELSSGLGGKIRYAVTPLLNRTESRHARIERIDLAAPCEVMDITVEGGRVYLPETDLVVHNCDEFGIYESEVVKNEINRNPAWENGTIKNAYMLTVMWKKTGGEEWEYNRRGFSGHNVCLLEYNDGTYAYMDYGLPDRKVKTIPEIAKQVRDRYAQVYEPLGWVLSDSRTMKVLKQGLE